MKLSIQRVAHQYLNKKIAYELVADKKILYKKYMATIRKALKPLGFTFSQVTISESHRSRPEVVGMGLEWGGFKGRISLELGYYHGRYENNSRAEFYLKRTNKQDLLSKEGTTEDSAGWNDLGTSDIRDFIKTIKKKYEGLDVASVEQNEKKYIRSLWAKDNVGRWAIELPNGHTFTMVKLKGGGYWVHRTGRKTDWRDEGYIFGKTQSGPKGAYGANYDAMSWKEGIAVAEEQALKTHTTNI